MSWFDDTPDILGDGLQAHQALLALGSGGLSGVGLGASRARWSFLPNAHTDFIFAIIGEETGSRRGLSVLILFLVLTVVGTIVAMRAGDQFGRLLAVGLTRLARFPGGGQHRRCGRGCSPITGVPLPFISVGRQRHDREPGDDGVLLNIARNGVEPVRGAP